MAKFSVTKKAENDLAIQLKKAARVVGGIIEPHIVGDKIIQQDRMNAALLAYSESLEPWAEVVSANTLNSISQNNRRAWNKASKGISKERRRILDFDPVGALARQLQNEQVALITSLPIEAGLKAQEITIDAAAKGARADVTAKKLQRLGEMTENRAILIARTETAKANTAFTIARATDVGATDYFWRTADDADVRTSHAALDGKVFSFSSPPFVSESEGYHHPGDIYMCRCWPEPIIPTN